MFYDRKIRYLDYCENGERIRGSGFVKTEIRDTDFKMELSVKGLQRGGISLGDVILRGMDKEVILGQIRIQDGCGEFRHKCRSEDGNKVSGLKYEEITGIRIPLGGNREVSCIWQERERASAMGSRSMMAAEKVVMDGGRAQKEDKGEEGRKKTLNREDGNKEKPLNGEDSSIGKRSLNEGTSSIGKKALNEGDNSIGKRSLNEGDNSIRKKNLSEEDSSIGEKALNEEGGSIGKKALNEEDEGSEEMIMEEEGEFIGINALNEEDRSRKNVLDEADNVSRKRALKEEEKGRETIIMSEEEKDRAGKEVSRREQDDDGRRTTVPLKEDKWLQLCTIYPHVRPFRDERDYLSLGPADFVLFSEESYRAVNNSFLLHGFYNYRHLILARVEKRGEIQYYIGVPGNYFDREKQVAVMFGFESFECAEEPAQTGDFGYYMMKVQL